MPALQGGLPQCPRHRIVFHGIRSDFRTKPKSTCHLFESQMAAVAIQISASGHYQRFLHPTGSAKDSGK